MIPTVGQTWVRDRHEATILHVEVIADGVYDVTWSDWSKPVRYCVEGVAAVGKTAIWPPSWATMKEGA